MASRRRAIIAGFVAGAVALVLLGGAVAVAASTTFIIAVFVGLAAFVFARSM